MRTWRILLFVLSATLSPAIGPNRAAADDRPGDSLRVMTFNLWEGGDAGGQALEQSAEVIRRAGADVVGVQESHGRAEQEPRPDNAAKIAKILGWHYIDQDGDCGIISRFPIEALSLGRHGATLRLPGERRVHVFNVHFNHAPYQPYQLLNIPYADAPFLKTAEEAVAAARAARDKEVDSLLRDLRPSIESGEPVFLTGDFNEPSHEDWTPAAAAAKRCPIAVAWPTTRRIAAAGLIDAFRARRPDPVTDPGDTWTPTTAADDPKDKHDRIDFVFARCRPEDVLDVRIVGESDSWADAVVAPYPSDHRAVVATFRLR